ncbi:hypothetical protein ATCC90586_003861 [Pythium insidiosum]|nr:hypothetical protein ATCC90586_003861 [Pythium insidiosum]
MWGISRRVASSMRPIRLLRPAALASSAYSSGVTPRRVLCVDVPAPLAESACVQALVQRGHVVDQATSTELPDRIADYDALLVAPTTEIPPDTLNAGARAGLRLIAVPADAIDSGRIDIMRATHQDLVLLQLDKKQAGDRFSVEAELALSLLLQLSRHIPQSIAQTKAQQQPLQRESFTGTELLGKTLGIVGLGEAGKCVVEMARAMGLQVVGFDPNLTDEAATDLGVKLLSLPELYAESDVLTFHAPLTARTRGLFDDAALAQCKPGVRIVSVAEYVGRSGLLNEETLLRGLQSGQIAGVAMDLLEDPSDDAAAQDPESATWQELVAHANVITKRHHVERQAAVREVAEAKRYRAVAENLGDALAQRYYRGVANGVFLPQTLVPEMRPFLQLSEALGRFLFHLVVTNDAKDPITRVSLATTGGLQVDITTPSAKAALQSAVAKGILDCINVKRGGQGFGTPRISLLNASLLAMTSGIDGFGTPRISLLNASLLAMTSGIDVRAGELASAQDVAHLNNSVTVQVATRSKAKFLIMGSVFGEEPRVVRINDYTDFPAFRPEGNILLFRNEDKPGAIAGILKELAAARINIANLGLSRQANQAHALGILSLDAAPSTETLETLKQLPTVESLQFAQV